MIEIKNLSFGYHPKRLLYRSVSMTLESGNVYGLLGKNGAGKSTLLKNIVGLLFPVAGEIRVNGWQPRRREPSFLQQVYYIPEEVYVPAVTAETYLRLYAPFYPRFDVEAFYRHLADLKVTRGVKISTLSFGQQKKFIIAFALACNTDNLLMDEPTNGLDIPSKVQFRKLISGVLNKDRIILISTHQIRDLEQLIDRVVIVDEGQLLLNHSIEDISRTLLFKTVEELPRSAPFYAEENAFGYAVVMKNEEGHAGRVNLEQLFNAVTAEPARTKEIFTV